MTTVGYRQEVFNVLLAQLLQERGVISAPESIVRSGPEQARRMPDVIVSFHGHPVTLVPWRAPILGGHVILLPGDGTLECSSHHEAAEAGLHRPYLSIPGGPRELPPSHNGQPGLTSRSTCAMMY